MRIDINPRSLLNLEHICEVLYKLHPSVLDYLVEMERSIGNILGTIDLNNPSLEEREFLDNIFEKEDYSLPMKEDEDLLSKGRIFDPRNPLTYEKLLEKKDLSSLTEDDKMDLAFAPHEDEYKSYEFSRLLRYLQLDTDEYIPIKIYIEVEDPVNGRKVKELVRALETTRAPEQFYLNKKEIDKDAYFAEGYNLTMNKEQRKKNDQLFWGKDIEELERLLKKGKLYP